MQKLIGIFGGTFDPVHLGHLNSIKQLNKSLKFDQVHWVLSARPPHKESVSTSIEHRFEMLKLAISDYPEYIADDREILREKKSYTYDTIQSFKKIYPEHTLCLIIGADSLINLHTWYRYNELIELVHIIVMSRPGYDLEVPNYLSSHLVDSPLELTTSDKFGLAIFRESDFDISSTKVRALIRENLDEHSKRMDKRSKYTLKKELKKVLPLNVIDYIQAQQNYTLAPQKFENNMQAEQIKKHVVEALEDLKGLDIRVIDIKDISDFADYMIVVSGTSNTHVKAIAREASTKLRKLDVKPIGENGADIGEWVLVDFGDVVLHVMRPEVREYYDLEKLWDVDVRELVKQHREQSDS